MTSRSGPGTRLTVVLGITHASAVLATVLALRVFLTPPDLIQTVPPQPLRYTFYAMAIFTLAIAAGSVLAAFLIRSSWMPIVYLWLVPLGIVLYPAVDPAAANFLYVGVTSHVGGAVAVAATALWIVGIATGSGLVFWADRDAISWRGAKAPE